MINLFFCLFYSLYAGPEVDIWSCGVILYALLCGSVCFDAFMIFENQPFVDLKSILTKLFLMLNEGSIFLHVFQTSS